MFYALMWREIIKALITTVVSVILQSLYGIPEVIRHTSGKGGTNAKFSVQIQQKLHTVVSGYLAATLISKIIKELFGLKTHPPLIFKIFSTSIWTSSNIIDFFFFFWKSTPQVFKDNLNIGYQFIYNAYNLSTAVKTVCL